MRRDTFLSGMIKDISFSVLMLCVIALSLYGIAGTWPPMVVVESGSMAPNIQRGDIVFVQGTSRTNITTYRHGVAMSYTSFDDYGDVIIFRPNGDSNRTPIIHRAMHLVEDGYITKGDNNPSYDQHYLKPVREEWIIGVARFRIPYVGYIPLFVRNSIGI
jgi:signal peptidase